MPRFSTPGDPAGPCPLCGRPMVPGPSLNEHHLTPRRYGGRETVTMHRVCHDKIHAVLTEAELRDRYNTLESLRAHPELAAFIRWLARKPPEFVDGHAGGRGKRRR
ncbi:restriction endonuclease [Azospirillum sp. TSO22-1]|uniref:restriction endonuclease n=1 Tax=Azospirillum sp. TSO22-1 TaxID=716789 RepID=UPI000D61C209|nr:restriction endonuclease [Azospirillum sp. TSO22-1]PWC35470.1 restriction endonuclease [Azospirillum sp. TSO22-1]